MSKVTRLQYIKSDGLQIRALPDEPPNVLPLQKPVCWLCIEERVNFANPNQEQEMLEKLAPILLERLTPEVNYLAELSHERSWKHEPHTMFKVLVVQVRVFEASCCFYR